MIHGTIIAIGNYAVPWSTETHRARSLREHGYRVIPMQENQVTPLEIEKMVDHLDTQLVLYTKTHGWGLPRETTETWRAIERTGVLTASVHLDLFWGIARPPDPADPLFSTGVVFTPDGDHDQAWIDAGIFHRYLRAGVVRDECWIADVPPRDDGVDVIFVGSERGYHPEWPHRQQLLSHLRDRYGPRFRQYGGRDHETVRGADLNRLYASTPVVVGDTLSLARDRSTFWSDRVYETFGRGGLMLHPRIEALDEELNYTAFSFGDWDGLDMEIDLALSHPEDRDEERDRLHERVLNNCTYTHRSAEMLHALGLPHLTFDEINALPQPEAL